MSSHPPLVQDSTKVVAPPMPEPLLPILTPILVPEAIPVPPTSFIRGNCMSAQSPIIPFDPKLFGLLKEYLEKHSTRRVNLLSARALFIYATDTPTHIRERVRTIQDYYHLDSFYLTTMSQGPIEIEDKLRPVLIFLAAERLNCWTAQLDLAKVYSDGLYGFEVDPIKASEWSQRADMHPLFKISAMDMGAADAKVRCDRESHENSSEKQYKLALCNLEGRGVHRDLGKGLKLLKLAKERGNEQAKTLLQVIEGTHQTKNPLEAYWNGLVSGLCPNDQVDLGIVFHVGHFDFSVDYKKAAAWYEKAANQGDCRGRFLLGCLLEKGLGFDKPNINLALEYYTLSAKQGYDRAQYILGRCFYKGVGGKTDLNLAKYWLNEVLKNGRLEEQREANNLLQNIQKFERAQKNSVHPGVSKSVAPVIVPTPVLVVVSQTPASAPALSPGDGGVDAKNNGDHTGEVAKQLPSPLLHSSPRSEPHTLPVVGNDPFRDPIHSDVGEAAASLKHSPLLAPRNMFTAQHVRLTHLDAHPVPFVLKAPNSGFGSACQTPSHPFRPRG